MRLRNFHLGANYMIMLTSCIIFWILVSYYFDIYNRTKVFSLRDEIISLIKLTLMLLAFESIIAFFNKDAGYSRLIVLRFPLIQFLLLSLSRIAANLLVKTYWKNGNQKTVVILGSAGIAKTIFDELSSHPEYGYKIVGILDYEMDEEGFSDCLERTLNKVKNILDQNHIDELFVAFSVNSVRNINDIVKAAGYFGTRTKLIPDFGAIFPHKLKIEEIGDVPILSLRDTPLENLTNRVIKRSFDIVFSLLVLTFCSPLFMLIALSVKLSSKGPILFVQERTGYNQKTFKCLKFRTMEVTPKEIADSVQAQEDDPRKTRIGNFLRTTNLDELPQFFNVLKGDMSVVGPRPHMLNHTEQFRKIVDGYMTRHFIKPGITGWAQVNGWRGPTDSNEKIKKRVEYDLWYMENWSFWLDIRIIILTILSKQSRLNAF